MTSRRTMKTEVGREKKRRLVGCKEEESMGGKGKDE